MANEFTVHRLNPPGLDKADRLAKVFENLVNDLDAIGIGTGHERAVVITKLQEASFFAKRGMALDPTNQVDQ